MSPHHTRLSTDERRTLLGLATQAIDQGLHTGHPPVFDDTSYPPALQGWRASFVTLTLHDALRGCIGSLEARRPLAHDVSDNAYAAAFRDPRFNPLTTRERAELHLHISILQPPHVLTVPDEATLCARLRPGIDGLIIEDQAHRATFLPSVWENLPDPAQFIQALKRKAGLPADYWSDTLHIASYTVETVE